MFACSLPRSLVLSSALSSELNFHNLSAPSRQVVSGKSTKERTFLRKGIARLRFTDHSFARVINQYFLCRPPLTVPSLNIPTYTSQYSPPSLPHLSVFFTCCGAYARNSITTKKGPLGCDNVKIIY